MTSIHQNAAMLTLFAALGAVRCLPHDAYVEHLVTCLCIACMAPKGCRLAVCRLFDMLQCWTVMKPRELLLVWSSSADAAIPGMIGLGHLCHAWVNVHDGRLWSTFIVPPCPDILVPQQWRVSACICRCEGAVVKFVQRDVEGEGWQALEPGQLTDYAWDEPLGSNRLRVMVREGRRLADVENDLLNLRPNINEYQLDMIKVGCCACIVHAWSSAFSMACPFLASCWGVSSALIRQGMLI